LPGVFLGVPLNAMVNQQLWTVPYELECYMLLAVFALFALHRRPFLFAVLTTATMALIGVREAFFVGPLRPTIVAPGRVLVVSFVFGVFLFLVKDRVEITGRYVIAALLGYLALILWQPLGVYLVPPAVAYLTVAIGLWNCRINPVISLSNYSYGVYLYGLPVQQVVSALFPHHRFWWFNIAVSFPSALILGFLSWHGLKVKFANRKGAILAKLRQFALAARDKVVIHHHQGHAAIGT